MNIIKRIEYIQVFGEVEGHIMVCAYPDNIVDRLIFNSKNKKIFSLLLENTTIRSQPNEVDLGGVVLNISSLLGKYVVDNVYDSLNCED